ncbi:MAG TPA: hypothetical protein VFI41_12710 [Gemmatimonadales bacterium]|nr:hypothetical protein [Gemmatimonadales bacterium]
MTEPTLPQEQAKDVALIAELMAAAPVPLAVHEQGRAALGRLIQALLPKAPAEPAPTKPELVV